MKNYSLCNSSLNLISVHDPFLLIGVSDALKRIVKAVNKREKIVIYGSYDLDKVASVSLLMLVLKYLNADVEYYIPYKIEKGNVFNCRVIEEHVKLLGASLVITVGCGINSCEEVEYCKKLGIDVIITDYHKSSTVIKDAIIINPNIGEFSYLFKGLSAVGISYKLAQAIAEHYHVKCIEKYLDLVAIGIVSSGAPLVGENLNMLKKGMYYLTNTNNYGIKAITTINKIKKMDYTILKDICNMIMPKANVFGRMDDARIVVELLTTSDIERAEQIAKYINKAKGYKLKNISFSQNSYNY